MTAPVTLTQIQTAIDTGNTYAVQTPVVQVTSFAFSGLDSASMVWAMPWITASNQFDLTNNGSITLATGVGIEDLEAACRRFRMKKA